MIGIDWGTSSFRAYRLATDGRILERRETTAGILAVADGAFERQLHAEVGDWLDAERSQPIWLSGMIGSRQGWREAPYVECPARAAEVLEAAIEVPLSDGRPARILPGLSARDSANLPDVMRGEETQVIGAETLLGNAGGTYCLPGTHSKYVTTRNGRILGFATYMTGEVFAALRDHTILGRLMQPSAASPGPAFEQGLQRAGDGGGLLHHLFGVRTRGLFAELPADQLADYLSGMLVGCEILGAAPSGPVIVIGNQILTTLYLRAFRCFAIEAIAAPPDCAAAGLYALARLSR